MFVAKHSRLWRRRLRRRPLLPFLLAATAAIDLVLAVTLPGAADSRLIASAGQGALIAQLALVAAWSAHATRHLPQRTLAAVAFSWLLGWWFFATPPDNFGWFVLYYYGVFVGASLGAYALAGHKRTGNRPRGFGIAGLLAWTTLAGILIAATRGASAAQVGAVLINPRVWIGVLLDAAVHAIALTSAARGWSGRAVVLATSAAAAALVAARFLADELASSLVDALASPHAPIALAILGATVAYQAAFSATLLVWLLGLRVRRRTARDPDSPRAAVGLARPDDEGEGEGDAPRTIDVSA